MSLVGNNGLFFIYMFVTPSIFQVAGKLLPLNKSNPYFFLENAANQLCDKTLNPREAMVTINIDEIKKSKAQHKHTFFNMKTNGNMTPFSGHVHDRSLISLTLYYARSPKELDKALKKIKYFGIWKPNRNILLVDVSDRLANETIPEYFKVLWQNHAITPLIIKLRANSTEHLVDIYRWASLDKRSRCGRNISTYKKAGFFSPKNNSFTFFNENEKLFHMVPPRRVYYCHLKVRVVIYPPFVFPPEKKKSKTDKYIFKNGFEIKLIKAIAEYFGLKVVFKMSRFPLDWGTLEANGSATGVFSNLRDDSADIGISSFTYIPRSQFIDFGPTYAYEDMIWCVPKPLESELWSKLMYLYKGSFIILYNLAYILACITVWLLSKFRKNEPEHNQKFCNCLMRCTADICGHTYNNYTPKTHTVRIFYTTWLIFTMHMTVLCSAALYSKLTIQMEYKHFTFQDILNTDLSLKLFSSTKQYINNDTPEINKLHSKNFQYCTSVLDCLEDVAVVRNSAVCVTLSMARFIQDQNWAMVCDKKAKFISVPITMVFRKHHYLYYEIYKKVLFLFEAGLIDYWKQEAIQSFKQMPFGVFERLDKTAASSQRNIIISFENLKPAFEIFIWCNFFATVVFLIELGFYYKKMYFKYKRDTEVAQIGFNN